MHLRSNFNMFKHPLVNLWFFLGFSISLLITVTYIGWSAHGVLLLLIAGLNRKLIPKILPRLKPFIFYFPVMLIFYTGFSMMLTDNPIQIIINEGIFGFLKLTLMVFAMMIFIESTPSQDIVNLARSIWVKINRPWILIENLFLFLSMTLRFYPTFQANWNAIRSSYRILGLESDLSNVRLLKIAVKEMPGLLIYQLRRSDDVANAMKLRGYGKQIPRGVTYPIPFNGNHLIQIIIISSIYFTVHYYATF